MCTMRGPEVRSQAYKSGQYDMARREFDEAQMVELIVLAGFYHMVSFVTNGLHLPLEDGAARPVPELASVITRRADALAVAWL